MATIRNIVTATDSQYKALDTGYGPIGDITSTADTRDLFFIERTGVNTAELLGKIDSLATGSGYVGLNLPQGITNYDYIVVLVNAGPSSYLGSHLYSNFIIDTYNTMNIITDWGHSTSTPFLIKGVGNYYVLAYISNNYWMYFRAYNAESQIRVYGVKYL